MTGVGAHRWHPGKSLGRFKGMIRGFRDPLQVGLDRVAERGQGDDRLALEERAAQFALQRADGAGGARLVSQD